jgi:hypothetical protein
MKRLFIVAAAASSFCFAAPTLAQSYPPTAATTDALPGHDIGGQLDALRARVQDGFQQGQLSREETDRLYREIDRIQAVEKSDRTSDGQLRPHDRTNLQGRIDDLTRSIQWRRADGASPPPPTDAPPPPPPEPTANAGDWTLDHREQWLQDRIDHGVARGSLDGREVARGQQELGAIRTEQARLTERDGGALSPEDRSYLQSRIDQLNQTLRWSGRNPPPPWSAL